VIREKYQTTWFPTPTPKLVATLLLEFGVCCTALSFPSLSHGGLVNGGGGYRQAENHVWVLERGQGGWLWGGEGQVMSPKTWCT
jgi:hypothetical protein